MMIKIKSIKIEEFRGIRDLTLYPDGKNFAICGPNGTGKSGAVDALEFGLTGNISRLSGTGTGDVSVKEHAPHVNSRARPDKAVVTITATIPKLNKEITIERSVKDPLKPKITPSDPDVIKVVEQIASHPEFVLSRRELILYILATPGKRSEEIQALLRIKQVGDLRSVLQKIANGYKREIGTAKIVDTEAGENLARALEIGILEENGILTAVNLRRAVLKLPPITILGTKTSFKDGLMAIVAISQISRMPKSQVAADLARLIELLKTLTSVETENSCKELMHELSDFGSDPIAVQGVTRERFLKNALEYLDQELCPVCDTPWNPADLRNHIDEKLKLFDAASQRRIELEKKMVPVVSLLRSVQSSLTRIQDYSLLSSTSPEIKKLTEFGAALVLNREALESFLPISGAMKVLATLPIIPTAVADAIKKIEAVVSTIPEPTEQDAARDFLTVAQERFEAYRTAQFRLRQIEDRAKLAEQVSQAYVAVSNATLDGVYKKVSEEFGKFYQFINQDDEAGFSANLLPSAGKLSFDVDFYGKGYFPPGAYHSEGHQDGMGFCLYLALMKHIWGDAFALAILDDVLMSVDSGHRREVCALLKKYFPGTQFILTTHDPVWLRHMRTEGLIGDGAAVRFRKWDVEHGPTEWDQRSVWEEIKNQLEGDDVRGAAGSLRHFLEYTAGEICHRLRAPVEYRGDAQYQLGDLLPSAVSALGKLLSHGRDVATTWEHFDQAKAIAAKEHAFSRALEDANYEQWQINAALHFNAWDNLSKKDFAPVPIAFKNLVEQFYCSKCETYFEVLPERGPKQVFKCVCGAITVNLGAKKVAKEKKAMPAVQVEKSNFAKPTK